MSPARSIFSLALSLSISVSYASDYHVEGTVSFLRGEGDFTESDTTGLSLAWYLNSVSTASGPLAEAGFLSRQSSLSYAFSRTETKIEAVPLVRDPEPIPLPPIGFRPRPPVFAVVAVPADPTTDLNRHSLSYRHVHGKSGWFGEIGGTLVNGDSGSFLNGDSNGKGYRVVAGRYLTDVTTLQAYFSQNEQTSRTRFSTTCTGVFFCLGLTSRFSTEVDTLSAGLAAKHVGRAFGYHYALSGFLQYEEMDTLLKSSTTITDNPLNLPVTPPDPVSFETSINNIWKTGIGGTWYFTPRVGISAAYSFADADRNQDHTYALEGRWFVLPRLELRLQLARTDFDGFREDIDQIGLTIGGRL